MGWAVLQTHVNAASRVERHLVRQGFEFYNPRERVTTVVRGEKKIRTPQLFQDYIFVVIADRWRALMSTVGVKSLLMDGVERPAIVPDAIIGKIRARERHDGLIVVDRKKFAVGERVQVTCGPFAYQFGIYQGQSARDRADVLMSWCLARVKEADLVAA